jgi:hypothetical protein
MNKTFNSFGRMLISGTMVPTIGTTGRSERLDANAHVILRRLVVHVMSINVAVF